MDETEKNILRRRRADLTDCLDVNRDLLLQLRALNLISNEHLNAIDVYALTIIYMYHEFNSFLSFNKKIRPIIEFLLLEHLIECGWLAG